MKKSLILFILGWVIYFIVKILSPSWIAHLHHEQSFEILSRFADGQQQETLEFYQGRLQETLFGPFSQTLSFLLLVLFLFHYSAQLSLRAFGAVIFIFLIITKSETLFFPPYGDAIGGPFAEALWLYHNSFNYAGLFNQPNFDVGGPRVYFFSLYPGFITLTLKLIPWTEAFLLFHHLLTFALTAAIAAMLRECGRKVLNADLAWLCSLILIALPLFQSQAEAINMEIPVAFFTMWAAYALSQRRWGQSAIFAGLAAATKGIGIIACGTVALVLIVIAFRTPASRKRLSLIGLSIFSTAIAVFLGSAKFFFKDTHVQQGLVRWEAGWPSLQKEFIFYLYLASLSVFLVSWVLHRKKNPDESSRFIPALMFLFAGSWFFLFINFYAVSPRYRVCLYPFLVFCVVYGTTFILKWGRLQKLLAVCVLIAASVMSYGVFYGTTTDNDHVLLERSLEYRNDLEVNRRLARVVEQRYAGQLIVAPFTIAQALAIPQLGYVSGNKKLNVMIYGFGLKYGGIRNYNGLRNLDPTRTVFLGVKVAPIDPDFSYPVGPRDTVIDKVVSGNKKASVFIGGYSIEALWRIRHGLKI